MAHSIQSPYGSLITAMVTPFDKAGEVDYGRARELTARLIEQGNSALVVSGTTGESPTLTVDEKLRLFREVKEAAGNIPVIAGTGDNETAFSIEMSRRAADCGVDALLLVVPYYNRPSQEGLFRHFSAVATAGDLPCILYNIPGRTSRNMEVTTLQRLAEVPNIVGVKESTADVAQWAGTLLAVPDDFLIYSGNDADTLPLLTLGCCGVISVISHLTGSLLRAMIDHFFAGNLSAAQDIYRRLYPIVTACFPPSTPSPAPVKAGLAMQGFDCGGLRLPLVEANEAEQARLRTALQEADLL